MHKEEWFAGQNDSRVFDLQLELWKLKKVNLMLFIHKYPRFFIKHFVNKLFNYLYSIRRFSALSSE